ncbi:MAG: DUF29 domain-containing protein [Planctomycetaceae bacterium]|nr:DUF29 domain-containing protein [Planctomycetaceae bacterium]MBV8607593.1 DUF29 domain-containing protein [Singulisphaera sp.]
MNLSELYETDEPAWLERMVALLKDKEYGMLDYGNLEDFLEEMARTGRREVKSRLKVLIHHMLKWEHQRDGRSRGWALTIANQQDELTDLLASGALRRHAEEALPDAYRKGVRDAMTETGLPRGAFPAACPWSIDDLLRYSMDPATGP